MLLVRVLSRLRALTAEVGTSAMEKSCWALAATLVDPRQPGNFNQSMMELGATVCKPTNPNCSICPVKSICRAFHLVHEAAATGVETEKEGDEDKSEEEDDEGLLKLPTSISDFPFKKPKKKPKEVVVSVVVFESSKVGGSSAPEPRYLFIKRLNKGLLANQWEFPSCIIWQEEARKRISKSLKIDPAAASSSSSSTSSSSSSSSLSSLTEKINKKHDVVADECSSSSSLVNEHQPVSFSQDDLLRPFPLFLLESIDCHWICSASSSTSSSSLSSVSIASKPPSCCLRESGSIFNRQAHEPIVHIFSHQRHTMHITQIFVDFDYLSSTAPSKSSSSFSERESRWFTRSEIETNGLTAGTKKILAQITSGSKVSKKRESSKVKEEKSEEDEKKKKKKKDQKSCV